MRLKHWVVGVGLMLAAGFGRGLMGQAAPSPMELQPPVSSSLPHQTPMNAAPVYGQPCSAIRTADALRVLGDGTKIEHHTSMLYRRDSQGRERTDTIPEPLPGNKNADGVIYTRVFDPTSRTQLFWSSRTKVATLRHLPAATNVVHGEGKELDDKGRTVWIGSPGRRQKMLATELPARIIEGMNTRGSRVVKDVPVGQQGNDRELVTTIDSWYSPELKLALLTEITDPFMGKTTFAFTGLKRDEPNPAIFVVPPGYVVKEEDAK